LLQYKDTPSTLHICSKSRQYDTGLCLC